MPRRRRRNRALLLTAAGVCAAFFLYVFGLAWIQAANSLYEPSELIIPRLIDLTVFIWLFWVGSSIGSFLNVVAWRMPRGESINGRSYCPRCATQLKARDNFPVFGWIALRGRCRACRLPISARYPMVEACVGFSLTLVGIAELYRLSLPGQQLHWHGGPLWTPVVDQGMLVTLLYHAVALSLSWAIGLIRLDGKRLPTRLVLVTVGWLTLPMIVYPTLMVVPYQTVVPDGWRADRLHVDAVMRVITAIAAAVVIARYLASGVCPGADPKLDPLGKRTAKLIDLIVVLAVPAVVIGWQAMPALVVCASLLAVRARRYLPAATDTLGTLSIVMPISLTLQLVFWRTLDESGIWPTAGSPPWLILASISMLLLVPLWLHEPKPHREPRPIDVEPEPTKPKPTGASSKRDERESGEREIGGSESGGSESEPASSEPVNGEPVNGEPVNGEPVNGEPVNGEASAESEMGESDPDKEGAN